MLVIAPLGNPGEAYRLTCHNSGWLLADHLLLKYTMPSDSVREDDKGRKATVSKGQIRGTKVWVGQSSLGMNNSGLLVDTMVRQLNDKKIEPTVLVIYDELDVPLGEIRLKFGGSSAGHNGIKSIINELGTDQFYRLKIGIGPRPKDKTIGEYVLETFTDEEFEQLKIALVRATQVIETFVEKGPDKAIQLANTWPKKLSSSTK